MPSLYADPSDLLNFSINQDQLASFDSGAIVPSLYAASSVADAYLSSQYELPLTAWGADLTMMVCHVAAYGLWIKRGFNPENPEDQNIKMQYDLAMSYFKDIAQENIHPNVTDSSGASPYLSQGPYVKSSPSRGWRRDCPSIDDLGWDWWNEFS